MQKIIPKPDIQDFESFNIMLEENSKKFASSTLISFEADKQNADITYKQFKEDIDALGTYLYSIGFGGKKHIALIGENCYNWIVTYFAVVTGSNIIVPIDKELSDTELESLIRSSDCSMVICSEKNKGVLPLIEDMEIPHILFDEIDGAIKSGKELLSNGDTSFKDNVVDIEDTCAIIFTSGTTGAPKGVMLSQRNLISDAKSSLASLPIIPRTIAILPLNHTFGFMAGVLCQVWMGYPIYINNSIRNVAKDIKNFKPGHISVVPLFLENFRKNIWKNAEKQGKAASLKMLIKVSDAMRKVGIDLRPKLFKSVLSAFGGNLRTIVSGGAPMDENLVGEFDAFGIEIINGYGITECSPIVSINRRNSGKEGSVGKPVPGVSVKIKNPDENGDGEILIKGDNVMQGYYNNPSATAEAFDSDWFNTGDIGHLDDDNYIYLSGRKKNLIILGNGKNVSPEELETLIGRVEGVDEVIVYSENNLITAEIYTSSPETKDAIKEAVGEINKTVASYKKINKIKFRANEFEKTSTRKIKRNYNN